MELKEFIIQIIMKRASTKVGKRHEEPVVFQVHSGDMFTWKTVCDCYRILKSNEI